MEVVASAPPAMMAAMNKRLLVIVTVFVAGFGAGYGLTWLLVSGPGPARPAEDIAAATAPGPNAPPAASDEVGPDEGAEGAAGDGPARVDDGTTVLGEPAEPVEDGAEDDPQVAEVAAPGDPGEDAAAPDPELVAPSPPATWWERCLGKVCTVDFGRVTGGLSVREGTLENGEEVVWRDRFANADRVGTLPVRRGVKVELHAVGMLHQLPVAAQVTWRDAPGKPLSGVIALNIGDKIIKLVP